MRLLLASHTVKIFSSTYLQNKGLSEGLLMGLSLSFWLSEVFDPTLMNEVWSGRLLRSASHLGLLRSALLDWPLQVGFPPRPSLVCFIMSAFYLDLFRLALLG